MLLNIKELAARLGVSVKTIRRWLKLGKIPAPILFNNSHAWTEDQFEHFSGLVGAKKRPATVPPVSRAEIECEGNSTPV